ncbi:MAG: NAD(+)/NADH kinase [Oscillospiraceae bacterium]|nr:NAD(+)/NADH kinase [Oscillospiraceae bacterium]
MSKILLCPNPKRDRGCRVTNSVRDMLINAGGEVEVCTIDDMTEERLHWADFAITFGGDGTILHAARNACAYGVPVLGVNLGHKGFIAELEMRDIDMLRRLISGSVRTEKRMMIDVELIRKGSVIYKDFALNDVVVGSMGRTLPISAYGDERKITSFSGDGIIVSTPTGSTAYNLSAGGPILEPDTENIILTPICPHTLFAKGFVLSPNRTVTVEVEDFGRKSAYVSTDGAKPVSLEPRDRIVVTRSEKVAEFIKLTERSFYERVSEKLGDKL